MSKSEIINILIAAIHTIVKGGNEQAQTEAALKLHEIIQNRGMLPVAPPPILPPPNLQLIQASIVTERQKLFAKLLDSKGFDGNDINDIMACLKESKLV